MAKTYREHLEERLKDPKFKKMYDARKKLSKKLYKVTKVNIIEDADVRKVFREFARQRGLPEDRIDEYVDRMLRCINTEIDKIKKGE